MEFLKGAGFLAIVGFVACAPTYKEEKNLRNVVAGLEGEFVSADGKSTSLSEAQPRTTVLQFASDTCVVCAGEVAAFKSHMKSGPPQKVRFVSLLVGAIPEDAQDWRRRLGVTWEVGIDPNLALFRKFCREDSVPCLVIYRPDKGIVLSHHGAIEVEEILKHTGKWED